LEGFEDGLTGRFLPRSRGRLTPSGAASFYQVGAVPFDKEEFFKKQIEECRELERQAANADDRAFWRQAVGRWEEQLRQAQEAERRRRQLPQRILRADA
jgi:hypothetical protein